MYPKEVREDAVSFFEQGYNPRQVTRLLNGPSWWAVNRWYEEYLATGTVKEKRVYESKFTDEQKRTAVDYYLANGKHQSKTVEALGYPSRPLLCQWIDELAPGERKKTKPHKLANEISLESKVETVVACCLPGGKKVKQTARDNGIDPVTLYNWRNKLLGERAQDVVDSIIGNEPEDSIEQLECEVESLKAQIRRLKLEKAVWEGAAELVKKTRASIRQT